jgi:hypothetical protein
VKKIILAVFVLTSCGTNYKIPSKNYDDMLISSTKNADGSKTLKFYRHDLKYIDVAKHGKLITRTVYNSNVMIYRYPISRNNVDPTKIFLRSGNNFISKTSKDTVIFRNSSLPIMNRYFYGKGVSLKRITESTYEVAAIADNTNFAGFYVLTTVNFEEIKNRKGFISDSLIFPIK